jgi:uncharacterized protein YjcR
MQTNLIQAPQALQLNLYAIEDNLAALANSFELVADDEARQLILDEIGQALRQAKDKRDAVVGFLRHCEAQQRFADKEIERIKSRRDRIAQFQTEFEQYIVRMIEEWRCSRCRKTKRLQIHHRQYRSHGGTHRIENLEPVCSDCHRLIHKLERSK